ncbi:MAG: hypothetical protein ACI4PH_02605 [Faecousia sp.]
MNQPGFLWQTGIPAFFIFKKSAGSQLPMFGRSSILPGLEKSSPNLCEIGILQGEKRYLSGKKRSAKKSGTVS